MNASKRPLIAMVEDDPEIGRLVAAFLAREGFEVAHAADGAALDALFARVQPDLVILDLMLPGEDGLSICRRLRAKGAIPILILSAKGDEIDRVVGLELGADDYLAKPFNPRELLARIRAILRRAPQSLAEAPRRRLYFAHFILDLDARALMTIAGDPVALTSGEFDLLACFATQRGRVLSREQILENLHQRSIEAFDRSVDMLVSRLRRKLDPSGEAEPLIVTVRNGGYLFQAQVRQGA